MKKDNYFTKKAILPWGFRIKVINLVFVDNDTDYLKVHELDYDPAYVHIKEQQMEWVNNWNDRGNDKGMEGLFNKQLIKTW